MPTSSLIFVVIVAIWAAFLVQHWVRRRESAEAARSVDRFTDDMRVLDPRPSVTQAVAAEDVTETPRHQSPLVARSGRSGRRGRSAVGSDDHEAHTMSPAASVPAHSQPARSSVSIGRRRLRAVLLLAAVLWVPVSIVLAVVKVLLWVSVPFALLTVAAVLVWLRTEARADLARAGRAVHHERADRDHHASNRRRRAPIHAPVHAAHSTYGAAEAEVPQLTSDDTQVIRDPARIAEAVEAAVEAAVDPTADAAGAAALAEPAHAAGSLAAQASSAAYGHLSETGDPRDLVFDLVAAAAADEAAHPKAVPAEPAEGTWSPVPVPAPTYTMKAKAEPRLTESGIPADVFDTPEFADEADELDDRALFARRAASQ